MVVSVLCLGAGQDVGRSCVVVTFKSATSPSRAKHTVMFDCGMHMGYEDDRRFPDFNALQRQGIVIDLLIVTHFHLDHCGALPYYVEQHGHSGPILMTRPTKEICPILLEDFRNIVVGRKGEQGFFTSQMIKDSVAKAQTMEIGETRMFGEIEVKAFYAGHVLGAAMFQVKVGDESVLYTGDYNTTADRHMGAASCPMQLCPTLLITESTYATTIRDPKRARERHLLKQIHTCLERGGKVLVPVFALGRVQELCLMVESYWDRQNLGHIPVYFSAGMAEKANDIYRQNTQFMNEFVRERWGRGENAFDFKYIKPFERQFADAPGPMLLFSSPGMLHSGMSLEVFKVWASDPANMLIIPGYCASNTVGAKVLAGHKSILLTDHDGKERSIQVNMQITNLSFSAHADSKGILQLVENCAPENVILVHGERAKMHALKEQIERELGIPCYDPANGEGLRIHARTKRGEALNEWELLEMEHLVMKQAEDESISLDQRAEILLEAIRQSTSLSCLHK